MTTTKRRKNADGKPNMTVMPKPEPPKLPPGDDWLLFSPLHEPRYTIIASDHESQSAEEFDMTLEEYNRLKVELAVLRGYELPAELVKERTTA
jgi:hypothetical protein